ncbi:MAG: hypothetical protein PHV55_01700 [Candidatus Omnitrophica bacterium]|nr:hypothetical protein [Candidatus Omnitrophota bacterium]
MHNSLQDIHLRINLLAWFYLFLAFLHLCAFSMFSTNLMILGKIVTDNRAVFVHVSFVAFLLYFSWTIRKAKKKSFWIAVILHASFFINGALVFVKKTPLFEIQGKKISYVPLEAEPLALCMMGLNALIIIYYIYIREYFVDNR